MQVLMSKGYLAVKLATLSEFEKDILDVIVFPESIHVSNKTDCMIFEGEADKLYSLLYDLSVHFDIELI